MICSKRICTLGSTSITCSQARVASEPNWNRCRKEISQKSNHTWMLVIVEKRLRHISVPPYRRCFNSELSWITLWDICQNCTEGCLAGRELHSKKGLKQRDLMKKKENQSKADYSVWERAGKCTNGLIGYNCQTWEGDELLDIGEPSTHFCRPIWISGDSRARCILSFL